MTQEMYIRHGAIDVARYPQGMYAYSVGSKKLNAGEENISNEAKNSFVEICWGGCGVGEVVYFGKSFEIHQNDVFYWLSGETHYMRSISPQWQTYWICLDGPLADAMMLSYRLPRYIRSMKKFPRELFDRLAETVSIEDGYHIAYNAGVVLQIVAELRNTSRQDNAPLTERCLEYINHHFSDPDLCIEMLCDVFQVPRSTLTKHFAEKMNRSLGNFIRDVRYGNALSLLRNTDLPIREIAHRTGYRNYSSFCRLIHRGTGRSPSEIRTGFAGHNHSG